MVLAIYNFYVFDRRGVCLFYQEWSREHNPLADNPDEDAKLVFGLLFSLKQLGRKFSPGSGATTNAGDAPDTRGNMTSFSTNKFTLHQYETASGLRFVLNTDKCNSQICKNIQETLRSTYADLYVHMVVRNPMFTPGEPIENPSFRKKLDAMMVGMAKRF
ncbi:Trafficking protein particle complex subunit 1 [Hondaea fermentalgiana]|uniref:Trafficking protein particle complex subunit n=1 Tax=Hondaea fermentalgiana TaxID=2315210 RepID=A0A2R5GGQ6_9STRA|nr:Trafficking protein particle complex subunit 1 [Hondaea fermentalgiana]|eukprot:GBG29519.1 Trafficking protein particle complex subunit 1 [Hondaea fermentalgiana]